MGDEELRKRYQVWQVALPAMRPLRYNHASIRAALHRDFFQHFDPEGFSRLARHGCSSAHNMGGSAGVDLLVSSSGSVLLDAVGNSGRSMMRGQRSCERKPTVSNFQEAYPGISWPSSSPNSPQRRLSPVIRLSRLLSRLIMPVKVVDQVMRLNHQIIGGGQASSSLLPASLPNGVDSLRIRTRLSRAA